MRGNQALNIKNKNIFRLLSVYLARKNRIRPQTTKTLPVYRVFISR